MEDRKVVWFFWVTDAVQARPNRNSNSSEWHEMAVQSGPVAIAQSGLVHCSFGHGADFASCILVVASFERY